VSQVKDPSSGRYVRRHAPEGHKLCGRCGHTKPLEDFPRTSRNKDGRGSRCKPCASAATREWRAAHPDLPAWRRALLLSSYGLTQETFDAMLARQGGGCALCNAPAATTRIVVDHDHQTGRVRGLLCVSCNAAIGKLGDSAEALRYVVTYLEENT